jgi:hypothetical protein
MMVARMLLPFVGRQRGATSPYCWSLTCSSRFDHPAIERHLDRQVLHDPPSARRRDRALRGGSWSSSSPTQNIPAPGYSRGDERPPRRFMARWWWW